MQRTMGIAALALTLGTALPLSAEPAALQDWAHAKLGDNVGTYADKAGSAVSLKVVDGPAPGQRALRMQSKVVQWAGVWSGTDPGALVGAQGLRFQAQSDAPTLLSVMLVDGDKVQAEHVVRLLGAGWQTFELPLASFTLTDYQDPAAPKGKAFDPRMLRAMNLSPQGAGDNVVTVGPVTLVDGAVELKDGRMAAGMAQDFAGLEASAYGPFADTKGSRIKMEVKTGAPDMAGPAAFFSYQLAPDGWCGEWVRAGADWKGQDWGGAKAVLVEVHSTRPLALQLAFNDANQNAYTADAPATQGKGWESIAVPISSFALNAYYQPPQARKGAPLDLSRIETFNLCPRTPGAQQFWVRAVKIQR